MRCVFSFAGLARIGFVVDAGAEEDAGFVVEEAAVVDAVAVDVFCGAEVETVDEVVGLVVAAVDVAIAADAFLFSLAFFGV